jgi:hypothetical protein
MKVKSPDLLPAEYECKLCHLTKPIAEMMVVYVRREKVYRLRPRCKKCHNERERGHRREYKRNYLQRWRRENAAVNKSYWNNEHVREQMRVNAARRLEKDRDAILIQGRMNRRGMGISLKEARELLKRFGPCYPSRLGLSQKGLRECERIRSALRRSGKKRFSMFEIRLMVYDDEKSNYIKPHLQKRPYQNQSKRLREWQQSRRAKAA